MLKFPSMLPGIYFVALYLVCMKRQGRFFRGRHPCKYTWWYLLMLWLSSYFFLCCYSLLECFGLLLRFFLSLLQMKSAFLCLFLVYICGGAFRCCCCVFLSPCVMCLTGGVSDGQVRRVLGRCGRGIRGQHKDDARGHGPHAGASESTAVDQL